MNEYGTYNFNSTLGRKKSFGINVTYSWVTKVDLYHRIEGLTRVFGCRCPVLGWGYPSNGLGELNVTCQANKEWSTNEVEQCERKS